MRRETGCLGPFGQALRQGVGRERFAPRLVARCPYSVANEQRHRFQLIGQRGKCLCEAGQIEHLRLVGVASTGQLPVVPDRQRRQVDERHRDRGDSTKPLTRSLGRDDEIRDPVFQTSNLVDNRCRSVHVGHRLEIVGLAYEFTGNAARDREIVQRFANHYGITYTLLLAGVSDKRKASATLPDLTRVIAYPTSLFIGRDGNVKKIYSGFAGPGTGKHFDALRTEMETLIESMLAEGKR
jgi:hypothetical protein